jgi:hypothetical protein
MARFVRGVRRAREARVTKLARVRDRLPDRLIDKQANIPQS